MKQSIFIMILFACGLYQCKKIEHLATTGDNAKGRTDLTDTTNSIVKNVSSDNTIKDYKGNGSLSDSSKAFLFIRTFYEEYLLGFENDYTDSLRRKYCTSELIEKLEKKQLDYDPFLNAQDSDSNLLKTLKIKKAKDPIGYYIISYVEGFKHRNVYIVMSLMEFDGGYKINDIITGIKVEDTK